MGLLDLDANKIYRPVLSALFVVRVCRHHDTVNKGETREDRGDQRLCIFHFQIVKKMTFIRKLFSFGNESTSPSNSTLIISSPTPANIHHLARRSYQREIQRFDFSLLCGI